MTDSLETIRREIAMLEAEIEDLRQRGVVPLGYAIGPKLRRLEALRMLNFNEGITHDHDD